MTTRIFCGTFEAEAYWRESDLARLPAFTDRASLRVIEAMDEMLFAFCERGDRVLTAKRMNTAHAQYLHHVGFPFQANDFDLVTTEDERTADAVLRPSIFERMQDARASKQLTTFLPEGARLEPFAVIPGASAVAKRYGLTGNFPAQEVIRLVNTKGYALQMRERLGIPNVGMLVEDARALHEAGCVYLRRGAFLIKDDYGVSGKGNQLIETAKALERIVQHVSNQAARGKRVRFILEPYLPKRCDFSCQFRIDADGTVEILSVQELLNNGLAFGASCSAPAELIEELHRASYFAIIEKVGSQMYSDGYYGDVCVDSMVLHDGQIVPLVEINARRSMSLIKNALDKFLASRGRRGCLTYVYTVNRGQSDFSDLLALLEHQRLLFNSGTHPGVLPLTSRTIYAGVSTQGEGPVRGRFYLVPVFDTDEEQRSVMVGLSSVLEKCGVHVTH